MGHYYSDMEASFIAPITGNQPVKKEEDVLVIKVEAEKANEVKEDKNKTN